MTQADSRQSAIVVQFGGRRQYAVPHALANRGRLAAFYTDLCVGAGAGRLVPALSRIAGGRMTIDLTNRRPPENVLRCTTTYLRWMTDLRTAQRHADPVSRVFATAAAHDRVARQMVRRGFGGASHVLTQFAEAIPLHHAARDAGLTVATDVNIAPSAEAIVRREQAAHPDWESPALYYGQTLPESGHWRRPMARLAEIDRPVSVPVRFCPARPDRKLWHRARKNPVGALSGQSEMVCGREPAGAGPGAVCRRGGAAQGYPCSGRGGAHPAGSPRRLRGGGGGRRR